MEHLLKVNGMSCNHCVQSVTAAIAALDAKAKVEINLDAGTVKINSDQPLEQIKQSISAAGYEVVA